MWILGRRSDWSGLCIFNLGDILMQEDKKKIYKMILMELGREHKRNCDGQHCNVSLIMLMQMGKELGLTFSDKEIQDLI